MLLEIRRGIFEWMGGMLRLAAEILQQRFLLPRLLPRGATDIWCPPYMDLHDRDGILSSIQLVLCELTEIRANLNYQCVIYCKKLYQITFHTKYTTFYCQIPGFTNFQAS